jgi:hypothetical protein
VQTMTRRRSSVRFADGIDDDGAAVGVITAAEGSLMRPGTPATMPGLLSPVAVKHDTDGGDGGRDFGITSPHMPSSRPLLRGGTSRAPAAFGAVALDATSPSASGTAVAPAVPVPGSDAAQRRASAASAGRKRRGSASPGSGTSSKHSQLGIAAFRKVRWSLVCAQPCACSCVNERPVSHYIIGLSFLFCFCLHLHGTCTLLCPDLDASH